MQQAIFLNENQMFFLRGFPEFLHDKVLNVLFRFCEAVSNRDGFRVSEEHTKFERYLLSTGESIYFPYRFYHGAVPLPDREFADFESYLIFHCMMTRSSNGFLREQHLQTILDTAFPEWCMPYILKLSSEYLIEILQVLYDGLKDRDNRDFQFFSFNNVAMLKKSYSRMVSYWNEYYRTQSANLRNYVGYKLFHECFLPGVNIEKLKIS